MTSYKTFETERLLLKPCAEEDANFIFRLLNTEKWLKYIGDRNVYSIEQAASYIRKKMYPQLARLGFGNYLVQRKDDGAKMGTCGIYDREGMEGVDIGFAFLPEFEKQGYAFEASRRLLQAAFEDFNLELVKAITLPTNTESQRLLERIGLKKKGIVRLENDPEDLFLYEISSKDARVQGMKNFLINDFILGEGSINERIRRSSVQLHPLLANAPLIYDEAKEAMADIYRSYLEIAQKANRSITLLTPTWCANPDRINKTEAPLSMNRDACKFMQNIKNEFIGYEHRIRIGGLIGPKNDCYLPAEGLSAEEARVFHAWQIDELVAGGVDYISPETLPSVSEALGMAQHASTTGIPYVISFVIGRNGKVLDGTSLHEAISKIDSTVKVPPIGYAINCAHPSFLMPESQDPEVFKRLIAFNANGSSLDHCDLENADCMHVDDVEEWGELMLSLNSKYGIKILGGCCGTNEEHIQYLVDNY